MATQDRTVVRGRRGTPSIDRLPPNETGLEQQPTLFNSGMWAIIMFVGSEIMFFAALFTTYFYLRGRIPEWVPIFGEKPTWHGELLGLSLVVYNTIALLSSSVTMQIAVNAIKKGDRARMIRWLIPTIVLGAAFLIGQGYEYTKLGFIPRDGVFAAVFFTLTGFHGAHVTGGVLFNSLCLYRGLRGQFSGSRHIAVEAASIYWHFVDVVWIGLFTTIYVIG
ncbi:MAG TPA: cytochrome c oxidase subunit 3 [Candidatus Limnocylindria bacterium]